MPLFDKTINIGPFYRKTIEFLGSAKKEIREDLGKLFSSSTTLADKIAGIVLILIVLFLGTVSIGTLLLAWVTYWNESLFYFFIDFMLIGTTVLIIAPWLSEHNDNKSMKRESLIQLSIVVSSIGIFIFLTSVTFLLDFKLRTSGVVMIIISFGYIGTGAFLREYSKRKII